MPYTAVVEIFLRASVLDPAGVAVAQGLGQMGYPVGNLRIGKLICLEIEAIDHTAAENLVMEIATKVLSNPVIENFRITSLAPMSAIPAAIHH